MSRHLVRRRYGRHEAGKLGHFQKRKPRDGYWVAVAVMAIVVSIFVLTWWYAK